MPFDLEQYPYLKKILEKTYRGEIVYRDTVDGAHDSNWVKEYELFYSKQPNSTPYVKRLRFKVNEKRGRKAGFVNIRPITDASEVSETFLIPPKSLNPQNGAYIKCSEEYEDYGEKVECTPYIMPETIFGMCIHASIWICLKILEKMDMIERALCVPEIQNLASGNPYADKQGLIFVQAARLLRMCRTSSFYIINKERPYLTDPEMLTELYAYVESCLPVIIGVDIADLEWWETNRHGYHSIVAIGHTMEGNQVNGFIFHDESVLPYQVMKNDALLDAWHKPGHREARNYVREMLVAVPPEVSLPFHETYHQFEQILLTLREKQIISETAESLIIRPMLEHSAMLFFKTRNRLLYRALRESNFPSYVWVFYVFDADTERKNVEKAKGFFVRDATAGTELRFFYLKDEKRAVYQVQEGKVYIITEGRKRRKRI